MKSIFPARSENKIITRESESVSKSELEEVIARLNVAINDLSLAVSDFDSYKEQIANALNTSYLKASRADIEGVLNANEITAERFTGTEAKITRIETAEIIADLLTLTDSNLQLQNLTIAGDLHAELGTSTLKDVRAVDVSSESIYSEYTNTKRLEVGEEFLVTNVNATESVNTPNVTSDSANIINLKSDEITADEINADVVESNDIESEKGRIVSFESNYITHLEDPQEVTIVSDTNDYYILFPTFTNGSYYIEARNDGGTKLWSVELLNSIQNVQFRWSESKLGQLVDLKLGVSADGSSLVQIHANALNEHVSLFRQSQSTDNVLPPAIYDTDQLPDTEEALVVTDYAGTYIQDVIFTNKLHVKELEMDSLFMDVVGIMRELHLTVDYDISGDIIHPITSKGEDQQYVQNVPICGIVTPSWVDPSEYVDSTDPKLIPSCVVANYDGIDYAGTKECEAEEDIVRNYPITNLGDNTITHGSQCIECNLTVECDTVSNTLVASCFNASNTSCAIDSGITNIVYDVSEGWTKVCTCDYFEMTCCVIGNWWCFELKDPTSVVYGLGCDIETDCITYKQIASYCTYNRLQTQGFEARDASGNPVLYSWLFGSPDTYLKELQYSNPRIDCWSRKNDTRYDELAAYNCESDWTNSDSCLVQYNATTNTIQPTDEAKLDSLEVDNLKVNCDAYIGHNLYVCGKTVTTEEETVSTSSDLIVLRQNNDTPLASGEASGIVVNKYDGTNNLALITDKDGVLRVGEVVGTDTTYAVIYNSDGDWYSDEDLTIPVSITGELTSWDTKEVLESKVVKYTNAVFTVFNYENLSPVLGRDEATSMTNNSLLVWNDATWEANTIAIPTVDGSTLKYRAPTGSATTGTYYWEKGAGIYCFESTSCYEAVEDEIPENSIILIDDKQDYTVSEDA